MKSIFKIFRKLVALISSNQVRPIGHKKHWEEYQDFKFKHRKRG